MSDTIDDYKALAEMRKQERAARRASAELRLKNAGLTYTVHNDGAHIVIPVAGAIFDYWPGTERWRMRDHRGQFGFDKMLAAIRQRPCVAEDLDRAKWLTQERWKNILSIPEEDKDYVDKMEKAYPHLKGEEK